jgi:hypothetical protein
VEIQKRVGKQGKLNVVTRHFHTKNDGEKIAVWRPDLTRIFHVFNVRSVVFVHGVIANSGSQTELAINTRVTDSGTHALVSNTHRTIVKGQEGGE